MTLTTKELLLIKDNIKMAQDGNEFIKGCIEMTSDPQFKNLCNQMVEEHERDINLLSRHVSFESIQ